jgi:hypothetical protein
MSSYIQSLLLNNSRPVTVIARAVIVVLLGIVGASLEKLGIRTPVILAIITGFLVALTILLLRSGRTKPNLFGAANTSDQTDPACAHASPNGEAPQDVNPSFKPEAEQAQAAAAGETRSAAESSYR